MVDHYGMADSIDATSAGPTGQLGEFAWSQRHVPSAIIFLKLFDNHASCRHIDAQSQGLCGEHHFDQALFEQTFDDLPEQGDHAGMMRGKPLFQCETKS